MAFEWKDRYSLNVGEVDRQHKKLFELGGRIYDLSRQSGDNDYYDEIVRLLEELLDYTEYHFKFEESLMTEYKFPFLKEHAKEHLYFVAKIKSISHWDIDAEQRQTLQEMVDFLSEWISSHIILEDRKYATFFKEKGVNL
jgi:hemerythrin